MSSIPPSEDPPTSTPPRRELLEPTPRIPSPFILPPPSTSSLLNRLQSFLPQIRDANERLTTDPPMDGADEEEVVVLEQLSSEDEDSDEEEDSGEEEEEEEESSEEEDSESEEDGEGEVEDEADRMKRLLEIAARPKVELRKKLVQEIKDSSEGGQVTEAKMSGIEEMD